VATLIRLFCSELQAAGVLQITNPTPNVGEQFGHGACTVGGDRVLIGAPRDDIGVTNGGAAYLYDTMGGLLTVITNPTPVFGDPKILEEFGISVAAVGSDMLLIGSGAEDDGFYHSGAAYLYTTNGTLITTFTNPTPQAGALFGFAVAGVGNDKVLIGASREDLGITNSGSAYLFSTNGVLLATYTNPTHAKHDAFGEAVASVGSDRVLIGAYFDNTGASGAGAVYLFSTNGTLLTTFTNPTPRANELFGNAVAAVGADKVLIGAYYAQAEQSPFVGVQAGAAYLFSTNGSLLRTFLNPTPEPGTIEFFGLSVAALGTNKVLIGSAKDNSGGSYTGAAYIYDLNGTLLMTITNPAPVYDDQFGSSVGDFGSEKIFVAARFSDIGATDAGATYLFSLQPSPAISTTSTNTVRITWPSAWSSWNLQQNNDLNSSNWIASTETVSDDGANKSVTVNPSAGSRYYRLILP
jgi:hypothetical protein